MFTTNHKSDVIQNQFFKTNFFERWYYFVFVTLFMNKMQFSPQSFKYCNLTLATDHSNAFHMTFQGEKYWERTLWFSPQILLKSSDLPSNPKINNVHIYFINQCYLGLSIYKFLALKSCSRIPKFLNGYRMNFCPISYKSLWTPKMSTKCLKCTKKYLKSLKILLGSKQA